MTESIWRKYPNKFEYVVAAVDVLEREVKQDGKLHSITLLGTKWMMPAIITAILGMPDMWYIFEYTIVDPGKKIITSKTVNYSYSSVTDAVESIKYCENPRDINSEV